MEDMGTIRFPQQQVMTYSKTPDQNLSLYGGNNHPLKMPKELHVVFFLYNL